MRKYTTEPASRDSAVKMLVRNAVWLCMERLGPEETAAIIAQALAHRTAS